MAPSYKIIFSTNNHGSFKMLQKMDGVDVVMYFPWDVGIFSRRAIEIINPKYFIVIQHDHCLTFVKEAKKRKIETILISGSIRPGEVVDYNSFKYKRAFNGNFFNYFDYIGVQNEKDKRNFIASGVNKEKLSIIGSLKMDLSYAKLDCNFRKKINKCLGINENTTIFLAGSTHKGDEEILIDAYKEILKKNSKMKLVIVPRYVERSLEIKSLAQSKGCKTKVIKNFNEINGSYDTFIIEMLGSLPKLYGIATVVFLGGSLIPRGGQNILEPMYHGKPVFFGPYMNNRKEICDRLKSIWSGIEIRECNQLARRIIYLLNDSNKIKNLSSEAKQIIAENATSLDRNINFLKNVLIDKQIKN